MKVLLINGSPHVNGSTHQSLQVVEAALNSNGMEARHLHIGMGSVRGCIDCRKCKDTNRCVFTEDICNTLIEAILQADGVIIGSPVYFAGPNGALCAILDRVFYAASSHGRLFAGKPAAAVASCYRAGTTATLDRLNKYFAFSEMPVVSSIYWNMVFEPHSSMEVDTHGKRILEVLGENMADMVKRGR